MYLTLHVLQESRTVVEYTFEGTALKLKPVIPIPVAVAMAGEEAIISPPVIISEPVVVVVVVMPALLERITSYSAAVPRSTVALTMVAAESINTFNLFIIVLI